MMLDTSYTNKLLRYRRLLAGLLLAHYTTTQYTTTPLHTTPLHTTGQSLVSCAPIFMILAKILDLMVLNPLLQVVLERKPYNNLTVTR